jgi:glucose-6-phosphate isomerase
MLVANRLGWLTVAEGMLAEVAALEGFAAECRTRGFTHGLLLGMGGSSLAPEVFARSFEGTVSGPRLLVVDTTDPDQVHAAEAAVDVTRTLFFVSSKSGSTIEVASLYAYFREVVGRTAGGQALQQFVAITDPHTPLAKLAEEQGFWKVFTNPPDIGGRYSALSYFGLLPAAFAGVDVRALLERAVEMAQASGPEVSARDHPGVMLGAAIGVIADHGRDKLTLAASPSLQPFAAWIEQLVAESTGKDGHEVLPVPDEPPAVPERYGNDRLFCHIRLEGDTTHDAWADSIEAAGLPLIRLHLRDAYDLGPEFFRWEFATAVAGSTLHIDPFDEPNVQESKDNTARMIAAFEANGVLPEEQPTAVEGQLSIFEGESVAGRLEELLRAARPPVYLAIMAYIERNEAVEAKMRELAGRIRDLRAVATTIGFGPRFLHSTGQLHKGGTGRGVFLQITSTDFTDVPIPGKTYGFSVLKQCQAAGDLQALRARHDNALRVHIDGDLDSGFNQLSAAIERAAAVAKG